MAHRLGVCSWSLEPSSAEDLAAKLERVALKRVQLHLDPLRTGAWEEGPSVARLRTAGVEIASGMMGMAGEDYSSLESIARTGGVRPDSTWTINREAASANAALAHRLGLTLVSFHAGFLPHQAGRERETLIGRMREMVDRFAAEGVRVAFETGQESAETLLAMLQELERPEAGVNFDPANLILYGMDEPLDALARLAPFVRQVHIKDAIRARTPGTWGEEVVAGTGEVDWNCFFDILREHRLAVDLIIEREAGSDRVGDIRAAAEVVKRSVTAWGSKR